MKYFGVSDKGRIRRVNQDAYIIACNQNQDTFAIVCDGIGGGRAGEIASTIATRFLSEKFSEIQKFNDEIEVVRWLNTTIEDCNDFVFAQSTISNDYNGMGTTLCGIIISSVGSYVFNVGDSRCYQYINSKLICLTNDHTYVQELLRTGQITEDEIENHPKKHVLINALGVISKISIDIVRIEKNIGTFLICTDGLHGYVPIRLIEQVLENNNDSIMKKAKKLVLYANDTGGLDNITIILLELGR